jgi:hypothetical protein
MNVDEDNVFIFSIHNLPPTPHFSYLKCEALNVGFYNNSKNLEKE